MMIGIGRFMTLLQEATQRPPLGQQAQSLPNKMNVILGAWVA